MFTRKIGIDLGTANTVVFVPGRGFIINEPTIVALRKPENTVLAVGVEAKEMIGRTSEEIVAYRPLKDGVIEDYYITKALLTYFIRKAVGRGNIFKPDVIISVPAGITQTERRAVIGAAKQIHNVVRDACTGCGACVERCPTEAVTLIPVPLTLQHWIWPKPGATATA